MKVLLTFGGTRERIDDVRFIANLSTGRTGSSLADALSARGFGVTCLCGEGSSVPAARKVRILRFSDFSDLDAKMRRLLGTSAFDAVIHLAAVSDYSVKSIRAGGKTFRPGRGKLPSSPPVLTLTLRRNFKILDRIKTYAGRGSTTKLPVLVGFKLTSGLSRAQAAARIKELRAADIIVHNDLSEMRTAHPFHIYAGGKKVRDCRGALELARALAAMLRLKEEICC